jgi:hypothetical protein
LHRVIGILNSDVETAIETVNKGSYEIQPQP